MYDDRTSDSLCTSDYHFCQVALCVIRTRDSHAVWSRTGVSYVRVDVELIRESICTFQVRHFPGLAFCYPGIFGPAFSDPAFSGPAFSAPPCDIARFSVPLDAFCVILETVR